MTVMSAKDMIAPYGDKFDTTRFGMIGCYYDRESFKMNDRRSDDLEGLLETIHEQFFDDYSDVYYIVRAFRAGKTAVAINSYQNLDTILRDEFPQWVWELANSTVGASHWKYENSLWGTDEINP